MTTRPTLRFGQRGGEIAQLHQALIERGILLGPNEITRQYFGPETVSAVRDFQTKFGLVVDGIVGPRTWAVLDGGMYTGTPMAPALTLDHLPPFVAQVLRVADSEYRKPVFEEPPGTNRGVDVDKYLLGHDGRGVQYLNLLGPGKGAPWCSRFALWVVEEASRQFAMLPPTRGWGDLASALKWKERAIAAGCYDDKPAPASIGCIITGGHGHVVIVVDAESDGTITTREGNSGSRVAARTRQVSEFDGFCHLTEPDMG